VICLPPPRGQPRERRHPVENPDRCGFGPHKFAAISGQNAPNSPRNNFYSYKSCIYSVGTPIALTDPVNNLKQAEANMKTIEQINMYDLATAFIAFGMVIGLAFR
jgi:hypothetical protein